MLFLKPINSHCFSFFIWHRIEKENKQKKKVRVCLYIYIQKEKQK